MAIQQINLGSAPSGAGGDTQRAANTKINENFSNTEHAASKIVGKEAGNVPLVSEVPELALGGASRYAHSTYQIFDANNLTAGVWLCNPTHVANTAPASFGYHSVYVFRPRNHGNDSTILQLAVSTGEPSVYYRAQRRSTGSWDSWGKMYSSMNTTKDTATGFLKASSPVLHVYNDSITKIHEAEQLDITVDKKGVGHYEIHGTTGLRKNDGWFMSPPRDVHGNVLCMVDLDEKDGVVILKTYKKLFDFETVSIVHDYENPMDIPDGVCVEFRFNDLPEEQLDEPIE